MPQKQDGGAVCPESDDALRKIYGEYIIISRVNQFTLIHLDNPSEEQVRRRVEEFNPDEFFFDSCALCELAKREGGHIVFDQESESETDAGGESDATPS